MYVEWYLYIVARLIVYLSLSVSGYLFKVSKEFLMALSSRSRPTQALELYTRKVYLSHQQDLVD